MIATSSEYCSGHGNCEVSLDKISNLRDAVLNFDLTLNGGAIPLVCIWWMKKGLKARQEAI